MSGLWGYRDSVPERAASIQALGFTKRQARFLVTVMVHSGVFVGRQYCRFGGIAHGQKTYDFIDRLVRRGFAREIRPGALHHGRLYHLHHKRLYAAIGQVDNRNCRRAPLSRMIERLMLLDAVLDGSEFVWLGTETDKVGYFLQRLAEYRIERRELPHVVFGTGGRQTLRLFSEKLPIGIDPIGDRYVFTYLVTRRVPEDFRAFLTRHVTVLKLLSQWRLLVLVPKRFEKAIPVFRDAAHEELATPLHPSEADELGWLFQQRKRAATEPAFAPDHRFVEVSKKFSSPRFAVLYRLWLRDGDSVLWNTYSTAIADKFERGLASVEFVVLSRQYLHLAHLVGVA
jgi:hypothetical protein